MAIICFDLTETEKGGGIVCYIKNIFYHRGSLSENFESILIDILLPKSKPITVSITYRPLERFFDDFDNALRELAPQGNETYYLEDLSINLFFEVHYV